jgi:hypothetical protein
VPTDEYVYRGRAIRIVENGGVEATIDGTPIVVHNVRNGYWTPKIGFRTFTSLRALVEAVVDGGG